MARKITLLMFISDSLFFTIGKVLGQEMTNYCTCTIWPKEEQIMITIIFFLICYSTCNHVYIVMIIIIIIVITDLLNNTCGGECKQSIHLRLPWSSRVWISLVTMEGGGGGPPRHQGHQGHQGQGQFFHQPRLPYYQIKPNYYSNHRRPHHHRYFGS